VSPPKAAEAPARRAAPPAEARKGARADRANASARNTVRPIPENPAQPRRPSDPPPKAAAGASSPKAAPSDRKQKIDSASIVPKRTKPAPHDKQPGQTAQQAEGARRSAPSAARRQSTLVPERADRPAPPARRARDEYEYEYEDTVRHKVFSAIAGVFLLCALCVAFWVIVTPAGQVFRASLGLSAPADAYKRLGDDLRQRSQYTKAADAYYNALKIDSANYEYALLVAKTQEVIGNLEKAEKAYGKCIELSPAEPEPYERLAEMYNHPEDAQKQAAVRALAYQNTSDARFSDPAQAPEPTPEPTPSPAPEQAQPDSVKNEGT
jgi:tetratricopeptide (TPR) repeat protein